MNKITVLVVIIAFIIPVVSFAKDEPTLEQLQAQRNQLAQMSQRAAGQLKAINEIMDDLFEKKLEIQNIQKDIVKKFNTVVKQIEKLEAPVEDAQPKE